MADWQKQLAAIWKASREGKELKGYPLLDWDNAAKIVNLFQQEIMDLKAWEESNDPASWLSQKPISAVQPQFIKNRYYSILGIVAKDATLNTITHRVESYDSEGLLTEENANKVWNDSKALAIHLDVLRDIPENSEIWADIIWSTVKDTGSGLASAASTAIDWGKYILIGCGLVGGGLLLAKIFGKKNK